MFIKDARGVTTADGIYTESMATLSSADLVERAAKLSREAHEGQTDKSGAPYYLHPRRVAAYVAEEHGDGHPAVIVALLHDVVEDAGVTLESIRSEFGLEVSEAVDAVTKRKGEPLELYYERVRGNRLALIVKAADIRDNTDPERLRLLAPELQERLTEKYAKAKSVLGI